MTEYPNCEMKIAELRLGDVVKAFDGPWGTAIVKDIKDGNVVFFRPYGATPDFFTYTGGVICYTGVETFTRPSTDKSTVFVYQRGNPK